MKLQAALEYLVVVAAIITGIIIIFYFALSSSSDSISTSQAQDAVNSLARSANYVYSLGTGTFVTSSITLPNGIKQTNITGTTIIIQLETSSGISDIVAFTKANVTGTLPNNSGFYLMKLNMTGPQVVITPS